MKFNNVTEPIFSQAVFVWTSNPWKNYRSDISYTSECWSSVPTRSKKTALGVISGKCPYSDCKTRLQARERLEGERAAADPCPWQASLSWGK